MVYLQQDAFDPVDVSMPRKRQVESFNLLKKLILQDYRFKNKDEVREFFTLLTSLYKNFNYSAPDTPDYGRYLQEIQELASKYALGL